MLLGLLTPSYITPRTACELVNLEPVWSNDPLPSASTRSGCPHDEAGLSSWHDASTWPSNTLPVADGSDLEIPLGVKVLLTRSPVADGAGFGRIHVPATSELIIGESSDAAEPISLKEIKESARSGGYDSFLAFQTDVERLFSNSWQYNEPERGDIYWILTHM